MTIIYPIMVTWVLWLNWTIYRDYPAETRMALLFRSPWRGMGACLYLYGVFTLWILWTLFPGRWPQ